MLAHFNQMLTKLLKKQKKGGMILNGCTDRKNTNPLIYIYIIMEASLFTNAVVWLRTLDSKANTNSRARALPKLVFA